MRDDDRMLSDPELPFGSGVIGVCDVCGKRQAVIVLQKERFKLCVIDFLNKTWSQSKARPGAPLPAFRSERVWYPTESTSEGKAPAVVLSPTRVVKHPVVMITPDVYGLTTSILDAAVRFAHEGFEVLLPDSGKTSSVGPTDHLALRFGALSGRGVTVEAPRVRRLVNLYADALKYLRGREMVDPEKSALFGLSYGGSLAVALAGKDLRLSAVALAYPLPVQPAEYVGLLTSPVFIAYGQKDGTSAKAVGQFRAHRPASAAPLEVAEIAGVRHEFLGRDLRAYNLAGAEDAWRQVIAFLRSRLMPSPPKPPSPLRPAAAAGVPGAPVPVAAPPRIAPPTSAGPGPTPA
ncbi:MAG: dienelactone hydrolase family protein [Thermoplasmata archaeon]|nr:dienelactone hydrolase family protein [Thermoplasmata archaeon]